MAFYNDALFSYQKQWAAFVAFILRDQEGTMEIYTLEPPGITFWKDLFREGLIRLCLVTEGSCGVLLFILTTRCSLRQDTIRILLSGGGTNFYGQHR